VRVVSLVPSATETLLALGADVVAGTRFCDQPGLAHVGGTKNPDLDAVLRLHPDVVVLDEQENRREDARALLRAGVRTFVSDVRDVPGAGRVVEELAALVGAAVPPATVGGRRRHAVPRRRAFVPIWRRPWMTIGPRTYGASVLDHVGWTTVGGAADYPVVELDAVAGTRPDVVLVPSEPYDFDERHLEALRHALPDVPVVRVDGRDLFWWGVRTPAALERIARCLDAVGS
jgi:ABC-type hemin transport system substrate-binding protein